MSVKTESIISTERIEWSVKTRFNPIRGLTAELLARQLERFSAGYLREIAILWDAIENRDHRLKSVIPKRKKAVSRRGFQILTIDDSPEANRHKETLEFFYNNLVACSAIDPHERGGFSRLARQMMDAEGKGHAVHEIIWKPTPDGLTAEFRFVPLWFFERTTGSLRFLRGDTDTEGQPLEDAGWLVTVGDCLMEASSVCYMFKHLSQRDWVHFNERFGTPGVHADTDAVPGTEAWDNVVSAVRNLRRDWGCVTSKGTTFNLIEAKGGSSTLPFPPLVEAMDTAMTILWRGGDLGTVSKGNDAVGASLQGSETDALEADDAMMLSEALQQYVDPWVIRYALGAETPLAYVQIIVPEKQDLDGNIKVDEFLRDSGVPLSQADTVARYGRTMAAKSEAVLGVKAAANPAIPAKQSPSELANEVPASQTSELLRQAIAGALGVSQDWLAPILSLIDDLATKAADGISDLEFIDFMAQAEARIPELLAGMDKNALADEIEAASGTAVLQGLTSALRKQSTAK